jgi:hypothetical protein
MCTCQRGQKCPYHVREENQMRQYLQTLDEPWIFSFLEQAAQRLAKKEKLCTPS